MRMGDGAGCAVRTGDAEWCARHTLPAYWLLIATLQDDAAVRVAPFDAIEFSLADLWG